MQPHNTNVLWSRPRTPTDIGGFLTDVRRLKGITQAQLAEALGVPRRYIIEVEAGKNTQYAERLFRLFHYLHIDITLQAQDIQPSQAETSNDFDW
ncbi:helix-turn-helix domain-containing protein [Ornithinimicrobium sp. Arc0846-15]|nr:helix-turn-helix domain-containing protein [Ornithinimicrobium laminariae]